MIQLDRAKALQSLDDFLTTCNDIVKAIREAVKTMDTETLFQTEMDADLERLGGGWTDTQLKNHAAQRLASIKTYREAENFVKWSSLLMQVVDFNNIDRKELRDRLHEYVDCETGEWRIEPK